MTDMLLVAKIYDYFCRYWKEVKGGGGCGNDNGSRHADKQKQMK